MPIDPNIALSIKPQQIESPLDMAGKALGYRGMIQNQQIGAERLRGEQLANQEVALKRQDDEAITKAWQQAGGDPEKTVAAASQLGARPQAIQGLQKHFLDSAEQKGKLSAEARAAEHDKADRLLALTTQAAQLPDEQYAQSWPQIVAAAKAIDPNDKTLAGLGDQPLPKDQLQHLQFGLVSHKAVLDQAEALIKQKAEKRADDLHPLQMRNLGADIEEKEAKLPGTVATSQMGQRQANASRLAAAAQQGPQALAAARAALPPDQAAEFQGLTDPTEIARVGLKPEERITTAETAANNAATRKNASRLADIAAGRLGIEQQHLGIAQQVYDQTYGSGANPALVGVEPKLRVAATKASQEAANEYTKAMESAAQMKAITDLARSGNKLAYAYAPATGVLTINSANGVKRVNVQELKAYSGAGSFVDQVEGWLGKKASGASIPGDILDAMDQFHRTIADKQAESYNAKLGTINQNYHANFKPVAGPAPSLSTGHKVGDVVSVTGGKQVKITAVHPDGSFDADPVK